MIKVILFFTELKYLILNEFKFINSSRIKLGISNTGKLILSQFQ